MKRILLMMVVTVTALCFTINASAQDSARRGGGGGRGGRSPEERAKMETERMAKSLALTPAQLVMVDSINLKFAKAQPGGWGGQAGGAQMEDRMAAMKKTQDEKNVAFKAVLTDKQYVDYQAMVEENRKRMAERMKNGPGGGN